MTKRLLKLLTVFGIALLLAFSVMACGINIQSPADITVTFSSNVQTYATVKVKPGAVMPDEPEKEGLVFIGWFKDDGVFTQPFTGFSGVSASITVYAKWMPAVQEPPNKTEADIFIALVNALPLTDVLANEDKITEARAYYETLSATMKNATDVTKALALLETIEKLLSETVALIIIVDASTSTCAPVRPSASHKMPYDEDMLGSRLWAEVEGARAAVNALDDNDYVGIISMNLPEARPRGIPLSSLRSQ
ncbi:MAG: InlB B-repeat-containing protein [Firmicutes bacterium]|nr:InlB B-repeat-containing protein [Bacillota bacterium]